MKKPPSPVLVVIVGVAIMGFVVAFVAFNFSSGSSSDKDDLYDRAKALPDAKADTLYVLDKELGLKAELPADFEPKANGLQHEQMPQIELLVSKQPAKTENALINRFEERKSAIKNDKQMVEITRLEPKTINDAAWMHTKHEYRNTSSFREEWYATEHKGALVEVLFRYPLGAFDFTIAAGLGLGSSLAFPSTSEEVEGRRTEVDALVE